MPKQGKRNDEEALRLVVEGTVAETGTEFFRALVRNLAAVMGTAGAWVTEFLPDENPLRTQALWLNGPTSSTTSRMSPARLRAVLPERKLVHFPDRMIELFPDDRI